MHYILSINSELQVNKRKCAMESIDMAPLSVGKSRLLRGKDTVILERLPVYMFNFKIITIRRFA